MKARRSFSTEFKREITEAIVSGKISQLEVSRKYNKANPYDNAKMESFFRTLKVE